MRKPIEITVVRVSIQLISTESGEAAAVSGSYAVTVVSIQLISTESGESP